MAEKNFTAQPQSFHRLSHQSDNPRFVVLSEDQRLPKDRELASMAERITCNTKLCQQCENVRLDDTIPGGTLGISEDGRRFVTFDDGEPKNYRVGLWHDYLPTLPNLLRSFEDTGCKMCQYLRQAIIRSKIGSSHAFVRILLEYRWFATPWYLGQPERLSGLSATVIGEAGVHHLFFKVESNDEDIAQWLGIFGCPQPAALCQKNISWILRELKESEDEYQSTLEGDFLPTRLLDLGSNYTCEPRLIHTSQWAPPATNHPTTERVRYCALSYCWGSQVDARSQLKTEVSSLAGFGQRIPRARLTRVMNDAIAVCRSLNIQFLWIDCLCIIQDDRRDWETESGRMNQIYHNAYFTICTLSSSSTHQSFLEREPHALDIDFHSSVDPKVSGKFRLTLRGCFDMDFTAFGDSTFDFDCAWSQRGWTFQENMMSSRKLFFGRSMLSFQCGNRLSREDGKKIDHHSENFHADFASKTRSLEDLYTAWNSSLCSLFLKRKFTFLEDKLPAISGLARQFSGLVHDSYIAGMWKKDMPRGLLWNVRVNETKFGFPDFISELSMPQTYIAPSWSFLSKSEYVEEGISTLHYLQNEEHFLGEAKSLEAWTSAKGSDPFGRIQNGTVRMAGRLRPASDFALLELEGTKCQIWTMEIDGRYSATCILDWFSPATLEPSHGCFLLLLASTCCCLENDLGYLSSGKPLSASSSETDSDFSKYSPEIEEVQKNAATGMVEEKRVTVGCGSSGLLNCSSGLMDCSSHEFCTICSHCVKCCPFASQQNRHAWGLLVHPACEPGKYYRAGIFTSRAGGPGNTSGTKIFKDVPYEEIDLI